IDLRSFSAAGEDGGSPLVHEGTQGDERDLDPDLSHLRVSPRRARLSRRVRAELTDSGGPHPLPVERCGPRAVPPRRRHRCRRPIRGGAMNKMKLQVEALRVESFTTASPTIARGTVHGNRAAGCDTNAPDCDPITCGPSCIGPCTSNGAYVAGAGVAES